MCCDFEAELQRKKVSALRMQKLRCWPVQRDCDRAWRC